MCDLIRVEKLSVYFPLRNGLFGKSYLKAVDNVSFSIPRETIFGLCGESGSGKTTTGKAVLDLVKRTSGSVYLDGELVGSRTRELRKRMQIIFQDPAGSLNPSKTIRQLLAEPLRLHKIVSSRAEAEERIIRMLDKVGMSADVLNRYPHEFSGGQLQRICICRALLVEPEFLVCDESIASLDVSIQAQIINLLRSLKDEFHLTILFISHNLAVLSYLCDSIGVMYLGNLVEAASAEEISSRPLHPYTEGLLRAIPSIADDKEELFSIPGTVPRFTYPVSSCRFAGRCPYSERGCTESEPPLIEMENGRKVRCFRYMEKEAAL